MPLLSDGTSNIADRFNGAQLALRHSLATHMSVRCVGNGIGRRDKNIRILLIHADADTATTVRAHLRNHTGFDLFVESSMENIATRFIEHNPEVVLIDADLIDASGYDVRQLMSSATRPVLILLAADTSHALRAFDLGASDCLLKPLCEERFELSLTRIREQVLHRRSMGQVPSRDSISPIYSENHAAPTPKIAVTDRKRTHLLEPLDIEWIGAAGDYSELHVRGTTHLLREPLSVLLGRLPNNAFYRIHRSFVVNLGKVSGLKTLRNQDLLVRLKDKTVLRASRTFSDELRRAFSQQCGWRHTVGIEN